MDRIDAFLVDAFTAEPLAGNAAGVVPDAGGLSMSQMQAVANELGASETAFLRPSDGADRRIRYVTPTTEVDLCGHATIASHALLHSHGIIDAGTQTLETNVGVLEIDVEADGTVWMAQDQATVSPVDVDRGRTAEALGIDPDALGAVEGLPVAVASTGLPWLVVPVTYFEPLRDATPNMPSVETLAEDHDAAGVYVFTFETLTREATLHARAFAPGAGVPEDPVTGTASGAAGAYLREVGAFDDLPDELRFEQGDVIGRPGRVCVRVGDPVRVGGRAAVALEGELAVPNDGEDDIIEV